VHFDQAEFDLRCEWCIVGLEALGGVVDVIVDVLSFTTAADVAVSNGASFYPYPWKDDSAKHFAMKQAPIAATAASLTSFRFRRVLFVPFRRARRSYYLPNGSALSLCGRGVPTFAACLLNAPGSRNTRQCAVPALP
jgi:2-phosphosulfolactate phosphatase